MKIYSKLFLPIFLIFPYLIIQNEFYSYSYLLLSKIFKKELDGKIFLILMICYFILLFFILIISFCEILIFEIIAGLLIIFSTILFYKPLFIQRNTIISYMPSLDILYLLFLGILTITKGIIRIIKKIKKKRNYFTYNNPNSLIDESIKAQKLYKTEINKTKIKMTSSALVDNIIYFLKLKKDLFGIYNFGKFILDIKFISSYIFEINIENLYLNYNGKNIAIREFKGEFWLYENRIITKEIKKGDLSAFSSCLLAFGLSFFPIIKNFSILKDYYNKEINKYLSNPIKFDYDNTFKVSISIQTLEIIDNILYVDLNTTIDKIDFLVYY